MSKKAIVTANPGESTIHIERIFDAPRAKVFKAMTTKELMEKWYVGPGYDVDIQVYEPREGGAWKFEHSDGKGNKFAFCGVFHEIAQNERIVQTFEFLGMPERGHVSMEKMELQDTEDGKTKMTVTSAYFSVEDRDGMIQSGMEDGMQSTYDALDKVLAETDNL
jgi:uncharacterized protein YndB with AHSA1/START domain